MRDISKIKRVAGSVLLIAGLALISSSESKALITLQKIEQSGRVSFAARLLGRTQFSKLASLDGSDHMLESFIYDTVKKKLRGQSSRKPLEVANAIITEANRAGMDPLFVLAVIEQESHFKVDVRGGHGEIGLMQLRPPTAKWLSQKFRISYKGAIQLYDPIKNIQLGVRYLSWLDTRFTHLKHSITAYNMGQKKLQRKLASTNIQPTVYFSGIIKRYSRLYTEAQAHILAHSDERRAPVLHLASAE